MRLRKLFAIATLALLVTGCGRVDLYNGLTEDQANEVAAALLGADIGADKSRSDDKKHWVVTVAKTDMAYAMQVLKAEGLPRPEFASLGAVFEKRGFVSSPLEEKARYLYGLSQELAQTLSAIEGVRQARVHIAMPERDVLSAEAKPSSASVVIVTQPGSDINARETDIKAIVKDGVEGLDDVNKVTVKFFLAPTLAPPPEREPVSLTAAFVSSQSGIGLAMFFAGFVVYLVLSRFGVLSHLRNASDSNADNAARPQLRGTSR